MREELDVDDPIAVLLAVDGALRRAGLDTALYGASAHGHAVTIRYADGNGP